MKWKRRPKKIEPKENDERTIVRFAWLPTPTKDGFWVRLEKYYDMQIYGSVYEGMYSYSWKWLSKAKYKTLANTNGSAFITSKG